MTQTQVRWCALMPLMMVTVCSMIAGERLIIQLKDFSQTEVKSGGFTLPSDMSVRIYALGGGEKNLPFSSSSLYAYGWIINAETRELVWKMDRDNTSREKDDRKFDDSVPLRKGSYEVYFAAYGFSSHSTFSNFNINIDRRDGKSSGEKVKKRGFFYWLEDLFGNDIEKEWKRRSNKWEIDLYTRDDAANVTTFTPPREFPLIVYKATQLGENEHIRQRFVLSKSLSLHVYAIGEMDTRGDLADYGWIVDARSHKRIWEMRKGNLHPAGGADKNVQFNSSVQFPSGDFILYYNTDNSHSFADWNAPPPDDPYNYGITLVATDERDKQYFKLSSTNKEDPNVIARLIEVGNDETRSVSFTIKAESNLRIYALGERGNSRHQMADYGWIINSKTREKVWTMDVDQTEHAGGDDKNRMIDEVITLPKGSYTVFYQTDDSHAYNDWNSSPPFDPEHWGITISGEGDDFKMSTVDKNASAEEAHVIAQIIRVGDHANRTQAFRFDQATHLRVYALGEGQNREMYDYGWIEDAATGKTVWEMTYSMTFHAGGGRKNRVVSTTIMLDKGNYVLHYVTDDSHSFNHWNTDPPDDPTMWGITLYEEK
ncbi:MAG: hypothetical protein HYR76_07455 [Ignavibacteria bacterium]|nr:hypothetical protein [Ignavibacteria bacterium]